MKHLRYAMFVACLIFVGCQQQSSQVELPAVPQVLNTTIERGAAVTLAVLGSEKTAMAWVTLDESRERGRLFTLVEGNDIIEIHDQDAIPVLDPETPPQIEPGPDGVLNLTYAASSDLNNKWSSMAIRFSRSHDAGLTWSTPVSIGEEHFGGYRNDHEMRVAADGTIYVSWLDSRFQEEGVAGDIRVVISRSSDGGQTWSVPVLVDHEPSCECCRVSVETGPDGVVYAGWRKILAGGIRDIVVARSEDEGRTWSRPVRVFADEWEMGYCPDAGPAMRIDSKNRLHVAWWTGKEGEAGVKYTRSEDGGRTFAEPLIMKTSPLSKASHVQLAYQDDRLALTWDDGSLETPRIALRVSENGGDSFNDLIYLSDGKQAAAYPFAAFREDDLYVIWHFRGGEGQATYHKNERLPMWNTQDHSAGPQIARMVLGK